LKILSHEKEKVISGCEQGLRVVDPCLITRRKEEIERVNLDSAKKNDWPVIAKNLSAPGPEGEIVT